MHPYPEHLTKPLTLRRLARDDPRDSPGGHEIEQAFVRGLSDESRYFRFTHNARELSPQIATTFKVDGQNPRAPRAELASVEEARRGSGRRTCGKL